MCRAGGPHQGCQSCPHACSGTVPVGEAARGCTELLSTTVRGHWAGITPTSPRDYPPCASTQPHGTQQRCAASPWAPVTPPELVVLLSSQHAQETFFPLQPHHLFEASSNDAINLTCACLTAARSDEQRPCGVPCPCTRPWAGGHVTGSSTYHNRTLLPQPVACTALGDAEQERAARVCRQPQPCPWGRAEARSSSSLWDRSWLHLLGPQGWGRFPCTPAPAQEHS